MEEKYLSGKNGYKIHDVSHNSGVLSKKINGFVVLVEDTVIDHIYKNGVEVDVKDEFGADVPLKKGAQIKVADGSNDYISEVELDTTGQINYAPHLNTD